MHDVIVIAARLKGEPTRELNNITVRSPVIADDWNYWRALQDPWGTQATIINIEHDHPFTQADIDTLTACSQPLCTYAYSLYFPTTHQHAPHYAQNVSLAGQHPPITNISQYTSNGLRWIDEGEAWADFSGIGFCKIEPAARVGALAPNSWRWVEMSINAAVGARWHVHWPAATHQHQ